MNILLITNSIKASQTFIYELLQNSWNNSLNQDKRKENKNFSKESDYFKIIDTKDKYDSIDKKFIPETVFIVPELLWDNDGVNEGYDKARELITKKYSLKFVQFIFLSILERETLKKLVNPRNKGIVEAFPHVCLLDSNPDIQFSYYSDIHYKLIKHLAISDEGKLQRISHEINSIKTNISKDTREVGYNKTDLITKLEELSLFQQWTSIEITDEIDNAKNATTNEQLVSISKTTENIIDEINLKFTSKSTSNEIKKRDKTNYKVFIIEDDEEYRKFFSETFSRFYTEVYPDINDCYSVNKTTKTFTISEAKDIINAIGKSFNIFLLDLLYKDNAGNWLNFNGLDLYRLVKSVNPYAVLRIITSLPRGIVAKLVEVITSDTEKPNIDQVYTKKYGFDYLKDNIIESIEKIDEECRSKAKSKTVLSPFPKTGVFCWPGIPDLMFNLLFDNKDQYLKHRHISETLFCKFQKNTLTKATSEWNMGQLPKPGMKKTVTDSYFLGKLSSIMTHRLIALNEALKNDYYIVNYTDYLAITKKIMNITQVNKAYFQTKLGFNGTEKREDGVPSGFKISFINMFPEEISFLTKTLSSKENRLKHVLLKKFSPVLNAFFKKILGELVTYENWDVLNLKYNPYKSQETNIDSGNPISIDSLPDLSLENFQDFLEALLDNYDKEFIDQIVQLVTDNAPGSDKIKYQPVEILINNLYNK
ncbi:MAG: hypothetical protein M0Q41_02120 [Bacteroidales bacterium]|nr:hypothetical protein [Acholeplasmataceae bacterium]MCK9447753.1 hypothetical protein [Bacteroidales bacterium]